jgi:hypothetical protein
MITLAELCAEMERSQRHLTPRAARDWWTKGLLAHPQRHGLGRQKGTVTFWAEPRVIEQAKAAHDLLARHSRAYTALIGLWLLGYPIELKLVRSAWKTLIARNQPRRSARSGRIPLDEAVGRLAQTVGAAQVRPNAPAEIKRAAVDICSELLSAFFGVDEEPATYGLAASIVETMPYWSSELSRPFPIDETHIEWLIVHIRQWCSLPVQRKMLRSATDYEFVRARRVLRVALGFISRTARQLPTVQRKALLQQQVTVIVLSRPVLLPLIAVLRDPAAPLFIPALLRLGRATTVTLREASPEGHSLPATIRSGRKRLAI